VFSAYIKDIEDKPGPTAWGAKMPFGELLLEQKDCGGWVHSVSFSPSGDQLALVTHSSSLVVVVSTALPRRMNVYHFKKGTEICNYSYSHDILAVRLNRQVGSGQGSRW
jgi:hypothetical protein